VTTHAVDDERALDRVIFFSDAVFAIAMTLLVLDLRVPLAGAISDRALWHALARQLPSFWSFALSFFVIGILWMAHQRKFRLIRRYDDRLLWLNLVFLFCIAFLPYPTAVLGRTGGQAATILYASSMAVTGTVSFLLTLYAYGKHRLIDPDVEPSLVTHWSRRSAALPLVFLISIPVAFASPVVARYVWLLVFVLTVTLERVHRRRHPEAAAPAAGQSRGPGGQ
jgi:TMEM175 potassium channel family protein